jgi:hypothetical protein
LNYDAITKEIAYNYFMMPVGSTTGRPSPAVTGMMRYNTTTGFPEFYNGTYWLSYQIYPNLILKSPSGTTTTYTITGNSFTISPSFTNTSPFYYTISVTGSIALTFSMNGAGGGGGGNGTTPSSSSGGNGGNTVGSFYLVPGNFYYLVIGQGGLSRLSNTGPSMGPPTSGIGGGGLAGTAGFGGEGGGLTALFLNSITLGFETSSGTFGSPASQTPGVNTTVNTGSGSGPILIAGGGGGGSYDDASTPGGVGGGGSLGHNNGTPGTTRGVDAGGGGGTLTAGGAGSGAGSQYGAALVGGSPVNSGDGGGAGAGGGGYFGGGGGNGNGGSGGGGGSGFYSGVSGSSTTPLVTFLGSVTGSAGAGSAGGTTTNAGSNGSVTISFYSF